MFKVKGVVWIMRFQFIIFRCRFIFNDFQRPYSTFSLNLILKCFALVVPLWRFCALPPLLFLLSFLLWRFILLPSFFPPSCCPSLFPSIFASCFASLADVKITKTLHLIAKPFFVTLPLCTFWKMLLLAAHKRTCTGVTLTHSCGCFPDGFVLNGSTFLAQLDRHRSRSRNSHAGWLVESHRYSSRCYSPPSSFGVDVVGCCPFHVGEICCVTHRSLRHVLHC